MSPQFVTSAGLLVCWGLALGSTLSLSRVSADWGHGVCGPWGCGPPLQSLLSCHASWMMIFLPMVFIARRILPPERLKQVGIIAILVSLFSLASLGVYERMTWWVEASEWQRTYFWKRVGFVVITTIDLPIVEVLIAGIFAMLLRTSANTKSVVKSATSTRTSRERHRTAIGPIEEEHLQEPHR